MLNFILYSIKINLLAALIIFLTCIISQFAKKKYSSWWRYYTWLLVSIGLIIPFGLFPQTQVIRIEVPYQQENTAVVADRAAVIPASPNAAAPAQQTESGSVGPVKSSFDLSWAIYAKYFLYIWGGGIIVISIIRFLGYLISIIILRRWTVGCTNSSYRHAYREVCKIRGIRIRPRLFICPRLTSPLLLGLFRPILYLPAADYSNSEIKLIFHHELAHYQNKDLWYKLLLLTVNTLYWFNPALYLMRKQADKDIEHLCDSKVMKTCIGNEHTIYHKLLLKTAVNHNYIHYISASLNDDMTDFKERIIHMMKINTLKKGRILAFTLAALFLSANLLVGCTGKQKAVQPEDNTQVSADTDSVNTTPDPPKEPETVQPERITDSTSDSGNTSQPSANNSNQETSVNNSDQDTPVTDTDNDSSSRQQDQQQDEPAETESETESSRTVSPNPPRDSSYKVDTGSDKSLVVYISNIDDSSFSFYMTEATFIGEQGTGSHYDNYTESTVLGSQTAQYNSAGYYECNSNGQYFQFYYDSGSEAAAGDFSVTVSGLGGLAGGSYGDTATFIMGLPFAG